MVLRERLPRLLDRQAERSRHRICDDLGLHDAHDDSVDADLVLAVLTRELEPLIDSGFFCCFIF